MKLPPLNAVRAFEAAARHENFSKAAEELHVTQGAVSRHIKVLEDFLRIKLFRRHPQGVDLTVAGKRLLPELTASLERIANAIHRAGIDDNEIRIISEPAIASRWLIPRLHRFQLEYPDRRVGISLYKTSHDEFLEGEFDLGIEQAIANRQRTAELEVLLLRNEALTPVCSPRLLTEGKELNTPADLTKHKLLHPSRDGWDWRKWFSSAGIDPEEATKGDFYETSEMAIRAAVAGMGITIGDLFLIQDELNANQLVTPCELVVQDGTGYFLIARRERMEEPKINEFIEWVMREANAEQITTGASR